MWLKMPRVPKFFFSALNYCSTTGSPEFEVEGPAFSMYPNPSSDIFSMWIFASRKIGVIIVYSVYSVDGKQILNKDLGVQQLDTMEKLDLNSCAPGVYLVELTVDGQSTTRRIVKN
jgi:hypothetical protein